MKKLLMLGLMALVLFAVSAAASWFLVHTKPPSEEDALSAEGAAGAELEAGGRMHLGAAAPAAAPRVAVRSPYSPGAEEAIHLANDLRDRLAGAREREAQLAARQKQLELIYEDIRGERSAVDELRKQVSDEMKAAREQMNAIERKRGELEQEKEKNTTSAKEAEQRLIRVEDLENTNLHQTAEMINNMAPDSAAKILQQMADTGKMETAVKLLGVMKERQAAKVLSELNDPALAAQLLEKMKSLKRPAAAGKK